MPAPPLIITIDGPAGAGKSTVAKRLAARLGFDFLDTGSMYRGVALAVLEAGIDPNDTEPVAQLTRFLSILFDWSEDPPALLINGVDVSGAIRDSNVTHAVSAVAANSTVRSVLVDAQRRIAAEHLRLVTEGRDQGSIVFPNAAIKFFLDASPKVRARRRADQLIAMGREADVDEIYHQIVARDARDTSRADGPLLCPVDAQRIDTSDMTLTQVVDHLESICRSRVAPKKPRAGA